MKRIFKIFVCLIVLLNFMMLPVAAATNYANNDNYRNLKVGDNLRGKTLYFDNSFDLNSLTKEENHFIFINDYMSDEIFINLYVGTEDNISLCITDDTGEYFVLNRSLWSVGKFEFSDSEDFIITNMTNEFEMIYIEDSAFNQMNVNDFIILGLLCIAAIVIIFR